MRTVFLIIATCISLAANGQKFKPKFEGETLQWVYSDSTLIYINSFAPLVFDTLIFHVDTIGFDSTLNEFIVEFRDSIVRTNMTVVRQTKLWARDLRADIRLQIKEVKRRLRSLERAEKEVDHLVKNAKSIIENTSKRQLEKEGGFETVKQAVIEGKTPEEIARLPGITERKLARYLKILIEEG